MGNAFNLRPTATGFEKNLNTCSFRRNDEQKGFPKKQCLSEFAIIKETSDQDLRRVQTRPRPMREAASDSGLQLLDSEYTP